jgi:hypothetical protein
MLVRGENPMTQAEGGGPADFLPDLPAIDQDLFAIHYSSELQENCTTQTPPISAIVVQHVATGQQQTFAALRIAERRGLPARDFLGHMAALERELLQDFFAFVASHPAAVWVHWAMRGPVFGFEVLAQRARLHGIEPAAIPRSQRFDLSHYLKCRYGADYAPHPRMWHAMHRNRVHGPELLSAADAADAWKRGEYAALLHSLSGKTDAIADLFSLVHRGAFQPGGIEPPPPEVGQPFGSARSGPLGAVTVPPNPSDHPFREPQCVNGSGHRQAVLTAPELSIVQVPEKDVVRRAEQSERTQGDSTAPMETVRVKLRTRDQGPIVLGNEKSVLTDGAYNVVKALLDAGEAGLSKDKLDEKSGHPEARKFLTRLREADPDWAAVIQMPGKAGRGYRIL